jgi:outer membrane protein assembly factor BamB
VGWTRQLGGAGNDHSFHVAVTADDAIVGAGVFGQTLDLGNGVTLTTNTQDVFVAELSGAGVAQWATRFGGEVPDPTGSKQVAGVAVAPSGRIVVVGGADGHWGGCAPCTLADGTDAFVRIFDENGSPLQERQRMATGFERPRDVAVAADGTIAIAGNFNMGLDFGGPATETGTTSGHGFVVKLDADGDGLWSLDLQPSSLAVSVARAVAVLSDGTVVVGGSFDDEVTLNGLITGTHDLFLAAFGGDGAPLWAKIFDNGDGTSGELNQIGIDAQDNIVIGGAFYQSLAFDGELLSTATDTYGVYLVKMTSTGAHIWNRAITTDGGYVTAESVAVHGDGRVVAGGIFNGIIDYGQGPVNGGGDPPRAFYVAGFQP